MKLLITGAAGFQAKFVIERLEASHELTLFDCIPMETRHRFVRGDITNYDDVLSACEGQDVVVHMVALVRGRNKRPVSDFADIMVKGTWHVAEACVKAGVKRLVNFSSIAATGWPTDNNHCYKAADHCGFRAADLWYAVAKSLGEGIVRAYREAHGVSIINLRPGVIANDGVNGEPQPYEGPPLKYRFVYVHAEDVAQAALLAVETENVESGDYYVLAGREDSWFDWREPAKDLGYRPEHNWEYLY